MWTSIHADKRSTLRKRAKTHLSVYWRSITSRNEGSRVSLGEKKL